MIDFLIIGAQKAGTSALDYYLRQHSEIGMANDKELHFFDNENNFTDTKIDYKKLESHFNFSNQKKMFGEATPIYMYWKPCAKRIWEYNKNIKLIIILRNPADRAFSHWNMEIDRNAEKEDFMYCIKNEFERVKEALPLQHRVYSYVDRGFYSKQIKPLFEFFNKKQLLFIKYEEFNRNQERTLKNLFDFLGVDADNYHFEKKQIHKISYKRNMTKEEREYLIDLFSNDINELEKTLQWDCSDWKQTTV